MRHCGVAGCARGGLGRAGSQPKLARCFIVGSPVRAPREGEAMRRSPLRVLVGARLRALAGAEVRVSLIVSAAAVLAVGSTAAVSAASAAQMPGGGAANPYSPATGHAYRHGVVPMRPAPPHMRSLAAAPPAPPPPPSTPP